LVERIRNGKEDNEKYDEKIHYDDRECYVFYTPVKYTEWTIVTVVPWQAIDMLGILNGIVLLLIIAVCMMLIVLVCNYYLKHETRPLQNLIKATDDIAKGHFDTPMPDIKHNDEMRQLCDSFEKMQYAFSTFIDNLKNKT
jgi:sigma-B regulation protein RsbU (phosphoserine phosphatase)